MTEEVCTGLSQCSRANGDGGARDFFGSLAPRSAQQLSLFIAHHIIEGHQHRMSDKVKGLGVYLARKGVCGITY